MDKQPTDFPVPMKFAPPKKIKLPDEIASNAKYFVNKARLEELNKRPSLTPYLQTIKDRLSTIEVSRTFTQNIYFPITEFPDINFVGLFLGPKGNTLKQLERETKTRLFLRGSYLNNSSEMPYIFINATTLSRLESACAVIDNLIEEIVFSKIYQDNKKASPLCSKDKLSDWEKYYMWWYYHNAKGSKPYV